MARVVGLTGGIGTGKSTVAEMLRARGAVLIDADKIVHELQAKGQPVLTAMVDAFGSEILNSDGGLDRKGFGAKVFADPTIRVQLGAIIGPAIVAEMASRLQAAVANGAALVVLDIPLLMEAGSRRTPSGERPRSTADLVEESIVVWATEEMQIARQIERDGATREHALQRIRAQMPIDEKRERADHVIDNSGTREATALQVDALFRQLTD